MIKNFSHWWDQWSGPPFPDFMFQETIRTLFVYAVFYLMLFPAAQNILVEYNGLVETIVDSKVAQSYTSCAYESPGELVEMQISDLISLLWGLKCCISNNQVMLTFLLCSWSALRLNSKVLTHMWLLIKSPHFSKPQLHLMTLSYQKEIHSFPPQMKTHMKSEPGKYKCCDLF